MTNSNARRGLAAGVLVALALALMLAPTTTSFSAPFAAGLAAPSKYTTTPLVIPAAAFHSDGTAPANMFFSFVGGYLRGGSGVCVTAPAYLPKGAYIREIWASVFDNDASNGLYINLYRVDNYDGSVDVMAEMSTTGAYASPTIVSLYDYPVDNPRVAYPNFSYYVGTCLPSSFIRLYSVRIWYDLYNLYLPALKR